MWWMFTGGLFAGFAVGFGLGAIFGIWLTGDDGPEPQSADIEYRIKSGGYGLEL